MIRYNPKGLTTPQIDESRRRHGDNVITPPKDDSAWRLLLKKFRDPIIRILLLAAVLSLIIGFVHKDFTESVGIICAIILATCVGFWFENRAYPSGKPSANMTSVAEIERKVEFKFFANVPQAPKDTYDKSDWDFR